MENSAERILELLGRADAIKRCGSMVEWSHYGDTVMLVARTSHGIVWAEAPGRNPTEAWPGLRYLGVVIATDNTLVIHQFMSAWAADMLREGRAQVLTSPVVP